MFFVADKMTLTLALPIRVHGEERSSLSRSGNNLGYALPAVNEAVSLVNVSVIMLNRRTALLQWWPRNALIHKDIEIVFTPEFSK